MRCDFLHLTALTHHSHSPQSFWVFLPLCFKFKILLSVVFILYFLFKFVFSGFLFSQLWNLQKNTMNIHKTFCQLLTFCYICFTSFTYIYFAEIFGSCRHTDIWHLTFLYFNIYPPRPRTFSSINTKPLSILK